MNSGQRGKALNAKDLTAEIDRATDVAVGVGLAEGLNEAMSSAEPASAPGVTNERAQALGRGAIFGRSGNGVPTVGGYENSEEVAFDQINNTGEASVEGAVELSEVVGNVTNPEATVGLASQVEEEEFERRDIETAENEVNPERSREAEIVYRNQEAVAKDVAPKVEEFLHEKRPELSGLMSLYREGRGKTLNIINHPIGRDN